MERRQTAHPIAFIGDGADFACIEHHHCGGARRDFHYCRAPHEPVQARTASPEERINVKSRDPVYFMVTTFENQKIRDQISTIMGYPFFKDSKVLVDVDGAKFTLFTEGSTAWIEDPRQEAGLVNALKNGKTMVVQGTSSRGTATVDSYSLDGSAALDAVAKECSAE